MYYYYGMSAIGLKPWWGKYLTQLQMAQFVSMIAHASYLATHQGACAFPFWPAVVYGSYVFSLLVLFAIFYFSKHGGGGGGGSRAKAA